MVQKKNITSLFKFTEQNLKKANEFISKYPPERQKSAVMALLDLAQRQNQGWLSNDIIKYIGQFLQMPHMEVYEVATFYSMFNLQKIGKYLIQLCGTTPCMLRDSENIKEACIKKLNIALGETTKDGLFTLKEVECLGACVNAPVVQINDDYYEDLTVESMINIIDDLKEGRKVKIGSQTDRQTSAPCKGLTSLVKAEFDEKINKL